MSTKLSMELEIIRKKKSQDSSYYTWQRDPGRQKEEGMTGFKTFECLKRLVIPNLRLQLSVWNMFSHPTQRTWNDGLQSLLSGITDATWFWKMIPMTWRNMLLPYSGYLCYSFPNVYINPLKTTGMFTTRFKITSSAFSNTMYLHVLYDSYNWHFIPIHYLIGLSKGHTLCSLCDMDQISFNFQRVKQHGQQGTTAWFCQLIHEWCELWVVLWYTMWPG